MEPETLKSTRWRIPDLALLSLALLSLIYAVATAPGRGFDLTCFQIGAREWLDGVFQIGAGPTGEYPPFTLPLLSPIGLLPRSIALGLSITLNIAATILVLYLAIKL